MKDAILWDLPPGEPPFRKNEKAMDLQHILVGRIRMFEYFVRGNYPHLTRGKREQMFIDLLEQVDPDDTELLIMVKDKDVHYGKAITQQFVVDALGERAEGWIQAEAA